MGLRGEMVMAVKSYRDLQVWQKAMDLVEACYKATETFPREQQFGLTDQLQRAAVSVPANIAEGHGRQSTGDYLRHLSIARGSLMELETHLQISARLNYLGHHRLAELLNQTSEIGRMLSGLISAMREKRTIQTPNPKP